MEPLESISQEEAHELGCQWVLRGGPPCAHATVAREHNEHRVQTGSHVCLTCGAVVRPA